MCAVEYASPLCGTLCTYTIIMYDISINNLFREYSFSEFQPNLILPLIKGSTPTCTSAAGVEQCCLEAGHADILQALINGQVHGEAMVRVHVG